jgi:hypothetical protein
VANGLAGGEDNCLYKNEGNDVFIKMIYEDVGSLVSDGGNSMSGSWGDFDNDGDLDLFVANDDDQDNLLYQNNSDGFIQIFSGDIVNDGSQPYGAFSADYDKNGSLDLYVTNVGKNLLY